MEFASLVTLALATVILRLARAELAEVLRRARHHIFEELKGNSTQRLTCGMLEPY